jgi:hypothetical protein
MSALFLFAGSSQSFPGVAAMNIAIRRRIFLMVHLVCLAPFAARADIPSFITIDSRLPNPDRPYVMQDGSVEFLQAHDMNLYDLEFQALDAGQLDFPMPNREGNWEFDSKYAIAYEAQVSFGLGPVHRVIGRGSAHIRGIAPEGTEPRVFDTEVVALDLEGLSSRPGDFLFRESQALRSGGKTIVADTCPPCARPFPIYRVSSALEIFAEASADGGTTWAPGDKAIQVVQQAEPVVLGDYNQNGAVDTADYILWRKKFGPGALANEAGVSNSLVDDADYRFWRSRFGAMAPAVLEVVPAISSVPEPSAFLIASLGILLCASQRLRMRRR